jgi:hypothetical protein
MSEEALDEYLKKHGSCSWRAGDNPPFLKEPQKLAPIHEKASLQMLCEDAEPGSLIERVMRRPRKLFPRYRIGRPTGVSTGPSLKTMCRTEETEADRRNNYQDMKEMIDTAIADDQRAFTEAFNRVLHRKLAVAIGGCRSLVAEQMAAELEEREGE